MPEESTTVNTSNESPSTQQVNPDQQDASGDHQLKRRWYQSLFFPILLVSPIIVVYAWVYFHYESFLGLAIYGEAPRNVILYMAGPGILLILISLWFYFLSAFKVSTKVKVFLGSLAVMVGFASCIETIKFGGDMQMILVYRWEKSHVERIAESRKKQNADTEKPVVTNKPLAIRPEEMPTFRGLNAEGVVTGPKISTEFSEESPPPMIWSDQFPIGEGHSQFTVAHGLLITMEQRGTTEIIILLRCGDWNRAMDSRR